MAIYAPDVVESLFTTTQNPTQRQSFAYAKKSPNGYYIVVEAVGGKQNPNVVPVMILQFTEAKWNDMMSSGMTLGELLFENDAKKRNALDIALNKKNRVTVAQFASKKAIASTPHSPQFGNSIPQSSDSVNTSDENPHSDRKKDSDDTYSDRDYSYEALTRKPDMTLTPVDASIKRNRADIVYYALQNAVSVGHTNQNGNAVVYVDDIATEVIVPKRSLVHGLDRRANAQAPVLVKIGEVLKNSIRINELNPRADEVSNSYVLVGAAVSQDGTPYIASFVVNKYSNEVSEIDVLYSANAKKESAAFLPKITENSATPTNSKVSIAQLLDFVNNNFPDILPESVLRHFGYKERPEGKIGESALFSDRDSESVSNRALLANALESTVTNEVERKSLEEYKEELATADALEKELADIRAKIRELSFAKGPKDTVALRKLRDEERKTVNRIDVRDKKLLRLEATRPLKDIIHREKDKAYKRRARRRLLPTQSKVHTL